MAIFIFTKSFTVVENVNNSKKDRQPIDASHFVLMPFYLDLYGHLHYWYIGKKKARKVDSKAFFMHGTTAFRYSQVPIKRTVPIKSQAEQ